MEKYKCLKSAFLKWGAMNGVLGDACVCWGKSQTGEKQDVAEHNPIEPSSQVTQHPISTDESQQDAIQFIRHRLKVFRKCVQRMRSRRRPTQSWVVVASPLDFFRLRTIMQFLSNSGKYNSSAASYSRDQQHCAVQYWLVTAAAKRKTCLWYMWRPFLKASVEVEKGW